MQLAVIAQPHQQQAWQQAMAGGHAVCSFYSRVQDVPAGAAAVVDLDFSPLPERVAALAAFLPAPVLINSVCHTLKQVGQPFIRINAWPGFLNQAVHEIAAPGAQAAQQAAPVLQALGWQYRMAPDVPGFITPRVIAMIVNEAFFALGEGVSTREEIDVAMRLGTGYPKGPFEWAAEIGLENIHQLLKTLETTGPRYTLAPALANALQHD